MATKKINRTCNNCGATFIIYKCKAAHNRGKYCSRECAYEKKTIHGETKGVTPEYRAWISIKIRCFNVFDKHYPNYGGRGITICEDWNRNYNAFLSYVGRRPSPKHSIDRYPNNNGNYEPGNVRWATSKEQSHNLRVNRLITWNGETLCVAEWSQRTGIGVTTLLWRIAHGWEVKSVLSRDRYVRHAVMA